MCGSLRIITELLPEGSLFDCIKRKDFWATLTLTDKLTVSFWFRSHGIVRAFFNSERSLTRT